MEWYAIFNIAVGIFAVISGFLVAHFSDKMGLLNKLDKIKIEDEIKVKIASLAVEAVEQLYENYDGEEKYEQARKRVSTALLNRGIEISEKEIETLIESSVIKFKSTVKKELNK